MKYLALILAIILDFIAFVFGVGYIELLLGVTPTEIPIVLEGTVEYFEAKYQLLGQDIGSLIICILCVVLSSLLFSSYHRLKKKKKGASGLDIKEPFVLYLRSFSEDKTTRKQVSFNDVRSEEEVLVEVLSDIAPVYAIGDPKDKKMPIGASRIYVDDEHWKETVAEMSKKASVVVLRLGKTDSFWWEVEMVLQEISLDKVLFIVPESKTFSNVAVLYKTLLDHNIDIKAPDICIDQKSSGSISSFLFFDKQGQPITKEVKTPRFTRLFLSYENIIRNTLQPFRAKFGLSSTKRTSVAKARLLVALLIGFISACVGIKIFVDMTNLKYQEHYELAEKCISHPEFVEKYSGEINGINQIYGIIEAERGTFVLDDTRYISKYLIELYALNRMSEDEFNQITSSVKNISLMVKKYVPEHYDFYTDILSVSAILAIQHSEELDAKIEHYKSKFEHKPTWLEDALYPDEEFDSELKYLINYNNEVLKHIEDPDIVEILKTVSSVNFATELDR